MKNLDPILLFTDKFSFTVAAIPDWGRNLIILVVFLLIWNYFHGKTDKKTILKVIYIGCIASFISFSSASFLLGSINQISTIFKTKYEGIIIDSHYKVIKGKRKKRSTMYKSLVSFTDKKGIKHKKITDLAFSNPPKTNTKTTLSYSENSDYVTIYNSTKWFSLIALFSFSFFSSLLIIGGISFFLRFEIITSITLIIGIPLLIFVTVIFLWLAFGSVTYNGIIGYQELNYKFWLMSFFWLILTLIIPSLSKIIVSIFIEKPKKKKKKKKKKKHNKLLQVDNQKN